MSIVSHLGPPQQVIRPEDQRVHPFGIFREITSFFVSIFYFFVLDTTYFGLVDGGRGRFDVVEMGVSGIFLAFGIARYAQRRYSVSDKEITMKSGLVLRRVDRIARSDIQAVKLSTPWLYRILKLAEVTILESSGQAKIQLAPLGRDVASVLQRLADDLPSPTDGAGGSTAAEVDEVGGLGEQQPHSSSRPIDVIHMRRADVLRLNAARFATAGAVVLPLAFFASRWFQYSPHLIGGLIVITVVSVTISHTSFRLKIFEGRVEATRGYVSTESDSLSLNNIQALQVRRSPLHRMLRLETVEASTAGNLAETSSMLAPALPTGDWLRIAKNVYPDIGEGESDLELISERSLGRIRLRLLLLLAPLAGLGMVQPLLTLTPLLAAPLALWWYPVRRVRRYGIRQTDHELVVRVGVITERVHVVPFRRVEAAGITQTFGQRRRQLATLMFTAVGDDAVVQLPDLEHRQAQAWLKLIVERSSRTANAPERGDALFFDSGPKQLPEPATKVFRVAPTIESAVLAAIGLALLVANAVDVSMLPVAFALVPIGTAICTIPLRWYLADRYRRSVRWRSTDRWFEQRDGIWAERREVVLRRGVFAENRSAGPVLRRYNLAAVTLKTSGARSPDLKVRAVPTTDADLISGFESKLDDASEFERK